MPDSVSVEESRFRRVEEDIQVIRRDLQEGLREVQRGNSQTQTTLTNAMLMFRDTYVSRVDYLEAMRQAREDSKTQQSEMNKRIDDTRNMVSRLIISSLLLALGLVGQLVIEIFRLLGGKAG